MITGIDHFPSLKATVAARRALADEYGCEIDVTHVVGADQTFCRSAAGVGVGAPPIRTAHCLTRPTSSSLASPG